ncbi:MAG: molybdopterin-dependent oxidoreductase, partial [Deltaproteobacteria bacterium]|nr:molybdopterin-dependent oxidoreductase [Deltaproteobacteria bacterium]
MRSDKKSDTVIVKSTCRMDHGGCGALVHVKEGKVIKIEGNPEHPISKGKLCVKGLSSAHHLYHPDRLGFPMKRVGERGEGKWERISWDEALDTIAHTMKEIRAKYGPEAIAVGLGTDRNIQSQLYILGNTIGTPNNFSAGHVCYVPKVRTLEITAGGHFEAGWFPRMYYPYDVMPECLMAWGNQASFTSDDSPHPCAVGFRDAVRNVNKLIVVDPRFTWEASKANLWLQLRPGTDAALALGMLNVIINEDLYDKDFVEQWTFGFDKLKDRVQEYTPEKVEEITWVPSEKIIKAARMYATSKPAILHPGVAIEQHVSTTQTIRALLCMIGITGNFDIPGGNVVCDRTVKGTTSYLELHDKLSPEIVKKRLTSDKYKLITSGFWPIIPANALNSILTGKPYPLRALFYAAYNPMVCAANTKKVYEALKKVDFMAISELYMTPTAELADIVLPASMWLERDEIHLNQCDWGYSIRQKAVDQIDERKSDWWIFFELAKRMGGSDLPDVEEYIAESLRPAGLTFDDLREKGFAHLPESFKYKKYEKVGFSTPSKKFELYSNVMEDLGYDPLPFHREPPESPMSSPELAKEYPLVLTTGGRINGFFHSEFRQIERLRRLNPDPLMEIHPDTASSLDIRDGDWVWIESPRGRVKQKAKVTPGIDPRVVHA